MTTCASAQVLPSDDSGWTRRFVAAPPRLEEASALYRSLGLEVRLEKVEQSELPPGCDDCQAAILLFRVIYTRPAGDDG